MLYLSRVTLWRDLDAIQGILDFIKQVMGRPQSCLDGGGILSELKFRGFPGGSVVKNLPANVGDAGDMSLIPVSGRVPGEGNGNPLNIFHYYCLENSTDRGVWQATAHGVTKSQTWLSNIQAYFKFMVKGFVHSLSSSSAFNKRQERETKSVNLKWWNFRHQGRPVIPSSLSQTT